MNGSALEAILQVALGMIFMWLIISVATMSLQEWIASYLKWRAKDLETAIRRLLGSDQVWAEQLYYHPYNSGLNQKNGRQALVYPGQQICAGALR